MAEAPTLSFAERCTEALEALIELLFLAAFFLLVFKLFWLVVAAYTMPLLGWVLELEQPWRSLAALGGIAIPVCLAAFVIFGDEEKPGWLVVAELRDHDAVRPWLEVGRKAVGLVGAWALLKLVWLAGGEGPEAVGWLEVARELLFKI